LQQQVNAAHDARDIDNPNLLGAFFRVQKNFDDGLYK
jgi:hypothetical protein